MEGLLWRVQDDFSLCVVPRQAGVARKPISPVSLDREVCVCPACVTYISLQLLRDCYGPMEDKAEAPVLAEATLGTDFFCWLSGSGGHPDLKGWDSNSTSNCKKSKDFVVILNLPQKESPICHQIFLI